MGDWVGAAVTPHLGPGEGPEESVGTPVGPGGPHHHRAATVVLETIRVALRSQPYTLLRLQGPDIGEELEKSSVSSPQPPHLSSPLAVSSLITFPPTQGSMSDTSILHPSLPKPTLAPAQVVNS